MSKTIKNTKADFEEFKTKCLALQQTYGLTEWELYFEHGTTDAQGECLPNTMARNCTLKLGKTRNPQRAVASIAKHEMIHLLISRFHWLAGARFLTDSELDEENEALTRKLEGLIKD